MKYYRDIDYFIFYCDFPHMGVPGVIAANSDGTVNIYINTLYSPDHQDRALRHELRHLVLNHFWTDTKTIREKEREADTEDEDIIFADDYSFVEYTPAASLPAVPRIPNVFTQKPPGTIPLFSSLESFRKYMFAMRDQYQRDSRAKQL